MEQFVVLRRLTASELGWFSEARRQGKARGRQRGINFNVGVMERIFGDQLASGEVILETVRYSDSQRQTRPLRLQQKNWRLVGDKVSGSGLEWVSEGDFFWCVIEIKPKHRPVLTWDVLSRHQRPDVYRLIVSEFSSELSGSMSVWKRDELAAGRLLDLLAPKSAGLGSGSVTEASSSVSTSQINKGKPIRSGRAPLRPRARLVRAIGEDLISSQTVALVELIKNSYDADAHIVEITFVSPLRPGKGAVIVRDDGHGMTLEVLQTAWMEPATISKRKKRFSPAGRRLTGEKGLGRFAAARLAKKMRLESIPNGAARLIVAQFNWEEFQDEDKFLDQISCAWNEFDVTGQDKVGTTLILEGLQDEWDLDAFRRLRGELSRLVVRSSDDDPFSITLTLPDEFIELGGPITAPPVLLRPHYALEGRMLKDGTLAAALQLGKQRQTIKGHIVLGKGRKPECGPFSFDIKVWDRERDDLENLARELGSTITDLRRDLNEAAGVSIYRDYFRVLPYGSGSNDWLRLDLRRVQNPTMRLSNNQIVGSIYLQADDNPELRDQTNREGIVESQAFEDLKSCVSELLTYIEKPRYELRRVDKVAKQGNLFESLDLSPVRAAFAAKYPQDREFLDYLEERDRNLKVSVEQIQDVIVRYRRLATLGQLVDVVLHDGRTPVAAIANESLLGRRDLGRAVDLEEVRPKLTTRFEAISSQAGVLSTLFQRISPFGGRKKGRPREYVLETLIADSFALLGEQIASAKVKVHLPSSNTQVYIDGSDVQQVIVNLLSNALYWLAKVPPEARAIAVRVKKKESLVEILFSDSGPGISEDIRELIFDPYFTGRPDGVGLGLTIAGEIVSEYGGSLELIEPGFLPGANFRITLGLKRN